MINKVVNIDEISPNPWNPNEMLESTFSYLVDSKDWFGDMSDILVWEKDNNFIIIDGEHRWKADKALGRTQVDIKILTTQELADMGEKLKDLAIEDTEYSAFRGIDKITDLEQKAEFVAKTLTFIMNDIRGESEPRKLARLLKEMEDKTKDSTLMKLLHINRTTMDTYKQLLNKEDIVKEHKQKREKDMSDYNEIRLVFKTKEDFDLFRSIVSRTGKNDKEAILTICKSYLDKEETI